MIIRRLEWAGAMIENGDGNKRILIDPVDNGLDFAFFGKPLVPFSPYIANGKEQLVLITHLHSDHFDPEYIIDQFGSNIPVLVPKGTERYVEEKGLKNVIGLNYGETHQLDEISIIASFSVDGLGDHQVSWIIKEGNKTILHSGDTLWHGYWWKMEDLYGPFDVTMLPINGAIVQEPGTTPSYQPICMTPEQAVAATKILNSTIFIPIHYGSFHHPPIYNETKGVEERVLATARQEKIGIKLLSPHEEVRI